MFKTTQTACAAIVFATFLALGANSYGGDIVKMDQVPMMRNDIFAVPMPPGWLFGGESTNETYVVSPDLSAGFGFVGLERIRPMSPRQFLGYIADVYKIRDFKVLGGKKIACDSGEMVEFEYTSTSADGRPVKSWARVVTVDVFGAGAGYIWSASAYADRYDAMIGDLQAMALRIQILDDGAAFNRAVDLYHLQNRNLNHPLDSTYTDAYWGRQVSQEAAAKRDSEVRRGSFMMLDPETGDKYWVGPTAFRPDGTVPNPARPTENLVPPKYWVHHSING